MKKKKNENSYNFMPRRNNLLIARALFLFGKISFVLLGYNLIIKKPTFFWYTAEKNPKIQNGNCSSDNTGSKGEFPEKSHNVKFTTLIYFLLNF